MALWLHKLIKSKPENPRIDAVLVRNKRKFFVAIFPTKNIKSKILLQEENILRGKHFAEVI